LKKVENAKTSENNNPVCAVPRAPSSLFFTANTALSPPYDIIIDTNFISRTVQLKLDMLPTFMDLLFAKCNLFLTDCVIGEMEKLGQRYTIALRMAKDERFGRLKCDHKGLYADDCIVERVTKHRVYLVATHDRDLKRRIRKIPGVPIISATNGKYSVERLPDVV